MTSPEGRACDAGRLAAGIRAQRLVDQRLDPVDDDVDVGGASLGRDVLGEAVRPVEAAAQIAHVADHRPAVVGLRAHAATSSI
jgi:hypothetical protein